MAETSTPEERTEMPTEKRWEKIRNDAMLPLSMELNQVIVLVVSFLTLTAVASSMWNATLSLMKHAFQQIGNRDELNMNMLEKFFIEAVLAYLPSVGVLMITTALTAVIVTVIQTGGNVREKWVKVRWDFLNPIQGVMRIFSLRGLVSTLRAVLKLSLLMPVGFWALWKLIPGSLSLISLDIPHILMFMGRGVDDIFWSLFQILIPFAIFDYFYTRYMFFRENKMTKDEVKDERKSMEGDEATKRKIRAKALDRAWQRIAVAVPKADVVIMNPTHYAVALKYDRSTMAAPQVVAKGKGHLALRIREIARESGVPMVQRRMLVRSLYYSVKVGSTIPFELFRAVAEVLAYVYRIKPNRRQQSS